MKRLKYTLVAMILISSMVLTAAITTGNTLAMIIDQTLELVNTFVPTKISAGNTVEINVEKIVVANGVNGLNAGGFTFELTNAETNDVLAITSNSEGEAGLTLSFNEEDIGKTFTYTLKERNDGREGFTYSTKEYRIEITVSLIGNDLVAAATLDGEAVDQVACEFVNIYETGDEPLPPPAGDQGMPMLYLALVLFSASCIIVLLWRKNKKSA